MNLREMSACIPNMIKFHRAKHNTRLTSEPTMYFIPSIAILTNNERAPSLPTHIADQDKDNFFFYNPI